MNIFSFYCALCDIIFLGLDTVPPNCPACGSSSDVTGNASANALGMWRDHHANLPDKGLDALLREVRRVFKDEINDSNDSNIVGRRST